jgi:pilus assembly protein FimV
MHHCNRDVRICLRLGVLVLLIAVPFAAHALGLGRLTLSSGLDEPLNGQIELLSPTVNEIKTLKTSLASREDFDIAGVERAAHLFDIKYEVNQSPNGKYFLKLTTHQAIREPFLHFLIQAEWSGGRLIREYSALLDPPHWATGQPAEIDVPVTVTGEVPSASVPTAAEPLPAEVAATETPPPVESLPPIGTESETTIPETAEAAAAEKTQLAGTEPAAATPEPAAPQPAETPPPVSSEAVPAPPAPQMPVEYMPVTEEPAPVPAPAVAAVPQAAPAAVTDGITEYGPVKTGETLTQIANKVNVDKSVTSQQVMLALLRANPSAFFGDNVNNLRAGKILRIPEREAMAAMPKEQAIREFRAQYDAWQEYKLKLAGTSRVVAVAEPDKAVEPPAQKPDAKKTAKVVKEAKKPAGKKAEPVDLLRIVRANLEQEIPEETTKTPGVETRKDVAKDQEKMTERVATLEEAIESTQLKNKEMRERVGKLQEQVKNTERLIELENKDLALAQKQAAEKQAAEAAAKAAQEKAAADKAAQEKAAADAAKAAAATKPAPAPAKPADATKPAPTVAKKPVTPPPPPEESFLDSLLSGALDNSLTMALLGAVGVLAAGMGGLYAYRRRRASREFSESILSSSSLSTDASLSDSAGQAPASDTSFLSDFSQGGMGNIHTDEVDPIAEAEVYLAYGRDEQAEEILKDAIVKDPARQELKGKLLEIYFQRNDVAAFETLAEELYAQLEGKGGKVWDKVEELGRKLSPNNPMFRGGGPSKAAAAGTAATTLLVPGTMDESMLATGGLDLMPEAPSGADREQGLTLDFEPDVATAPGGKESGFDLDFNFGTTAAAAAAETADEALDFNASPVTADAGGIDFSTSTETFGEADFRSGGTADTSTDFAGSTTTITGDEEGGLPGWDETATKLDLAKAYIDMGDSEGARSILDEVMAEGNDQQKQQARDLASQIAA